MILLGSSDEGPKKYLECIKDINLRDKLLFIDKGKISKLKSIDKKKIKLIITGTSLGNSIDKKMVYFGRKNKINTISIIEHWTNFQSRFKLNNKNYLPDRILVNDKIALNFAIKNKLPKEKIAVVGNLRLEKIENIKLKKLSKWSKEVKKKYKRIILFISEPIKKDQRFLETDYKCNEIYTLNKLIKLIDRNTLLIIKVHPNEKITKFSSFEKKNIIIKKKMTFTDMVKLPTKIVGIKSMLLIELALLRNNIISYRPIKDNAFIGEKLRITILVRKNLKKYLYNFVKFRLRKKKFFQKSNQKFKTIINQYI